MGKEIFLIHWNTPEAEEYARDLRDKGWDVRIEMEDGARAAKSIRERLPDVVLIYLTRLPSHGRETARYLRELKATRDLPIIFVGGSPDKVANVKESVPQAVYTSEVGLDRELAALFEQA